GRGANRDLHWRYAGGGVHDLAPRSRGMAINSRAGWARGQAAGVRFRPQFLEAVYVVGGIDWRRLSHHREPRDRSIDRATASRCPQPTAIGDGPALERRRHLSAVCFVPDCWRDAAGVLPLAILVVWEGRLHLSQIHR